MLLMKHVWEIVKLDKRGGVSLIACSRKRHSRRLTGILEVPEVFQQWD